MLASCDLLQRLRLGIRLQARHSEVDHLRVLQVIVVLKARLSSLEVVAGKHRLLGGLGLTAGHVGLNGRNVACGLGPSVVCLLIVALQDGHRSGLGVVVVEVRLHDAHSLLEVVIYFAASRVRGVCNLLRARLVLELSFR